MANWSEQEVAAKWIISEALATQSEDLLLIIHDEETQGTAQLLRQAADRIGAQPIQRLIPRTEQGRLSLIANKSTLPQDLRAQINKCSRVVFLQGLDHTVNAFRLQVLRYCDEKTGKRVASMPGVTAEYLPLCGGNMAEILRKCHSLATVLLRSSTARIFTSDISGESHQLTIGLGHHKPIMSTGIIGAGSWGNVPSGETFIVPNLYAASGSVAINGSCYKRPFVAGSQELVLHFSKGKVTSVETSDTALRQHTHEFLLGSEGQEAVPNSSVLSELGIGTNEHIKGFTGIPLFDEKVLGTAHLGLGASLQFGGPTPCGLHMDYVISCSRLMLDDVLVLDNGRYLLKESDVYPSAEELDIVLLDAQSELVLGPSTADVRSIDGMELARLSWTLHRGDHPQLTQIGNIHTSQLAARILLVLRECEGRSRLPEIASKLSLAQDAPMLLGTLELLLRYRLVSKGGADA